MLIELLDKLDTNFYTTIFYLLLLLTMFMVTLIVTISTLTVLILNHKLDYMDKFYRLNIKYLGNSDNTNEHKEKQ